MGQEESERKADASKGHRVQTAVAPVTLGISSPPFEVILYPTPYPKTSLPTTGSRVRIREGREKERGALISFIFPRSVAAGMGRKEEGLLASSSTP